MIRLAVPDTEVTPVPEGVAQVPSPRQNVDDVAPVPELRLVTGRLPVTPVLKGKFVPLVKFTEVGVPKIGEIKVGALLNTNKPDPVSSVIAAAKLALDGVARNVATLAPSPLTPVDMGKPVQFVRVPLAGVPNIGPISVGPVPLTGAPLPVKATIDGMEEPSVTSIERAAGAKIEKVEAFE